MLQVRDKDLVQLLEEECKSIQGTKQMHTPLAHMCSCHTTMHTQGRDQTRVYQATENLDQLLEEEPLQPIGTEQMHTCHSHMCSCHATMHTLESENANSSSQELGLEQRKDVNLESICLYLEKEKLPTDAKKAEMTVRQARDFVLIDGVLHFVEKEGGRRRIAVPSQLRQNILQEYHGGVYSGHFASSKLYGAMSRCWWWPGMYKDVVEFCRSCPNCAVVMGGGRKQVPPLQPIPVQ